MAGSGKSLNQGQGWEVMPQVLPDLNKHLIKISLVFNIAFSIPKVKFSLHSRYLKVQY